MRFVKFIGSDLADAILGPGTRINSRSGTRIGINGIASELRIGPWYQKIRQVRGLYKSEFFNPKYIFPSVGPSQNMGLIYAKFNVILNYIFQLIYSNYTSSVIYFLYVLYIFPKQRIQIIVNKSCKIG